MLYSKQKFKKMQGGGILERVAWMALFIVMAFITMFGIPWLFGVITGKKILNI
jgi:hypothetical protein